MCDINKVMQMLLVFRKSCKSREWGGDIGILMGRKQKTKTKTEREKTEKCILSSLVNPAPLLLYHGRTSKKRITGKKPGLVHFRPRASHSPSTTSAAAENRVLPRNCKKSIPHGRLWCDKIYLGGNRRLPPRFPIPHLCPALEKSPTSSSSKPKQRPASRVSVSYKSSVLQSHVVCCGPCGC